MWEGETMTFPMRCFFFFPFNSHLVPILNAIQWCSGMLYEFREWNITRKPKSKGLSRAMIVYQWLPGLFAENAEFASHDIRMKNLWFNQCLFVKSYYIPSLMNIILCRTSITPCRLPFLELWNITIELWLRPTSRWTTAVFFWGAARGWSLHRGAPSSTAVGWGAVALTHTGPGGRRRLGDGWLGDGPPGGGLEDSQRFFFDHMTMFSHVYLVRTCFLSLLDTSIYRGFRKFAHVTFEETGR